MDFTQRPVAKRTRSQRNQFIEDEYRRTWGNNTEESSQYSSSTHTAEPVQGSSSRAGSSLNPSNKARKRVIESSDSESDTSGDTNDTKEDEDDPDISVKEEDGDLSDSEDDIIELGEKDCEPVKTTPPKRCLYKGGVKVGRESEFYNVGSSSGVKKKPGRPRKPVFVDLASSSDPETDGGGKQQPKKSVESPKRVVQLSPPKNSLYKGGVEIGRKSGFYNVGSSSGIKKKPGGPKKPVFVDPALSSDNETDGDNGGEKQQLTESMEALKRAVQLSPPKKYMDTPKKKILVYDTTSSSEEEDEDDDDDSDEDWQAGGSEGEEIPKKKCTRKSITSSEEEDRGEKESESSAEDSDEFIDEETAKKRGYDVAKRTRSKSISPSLQAQYINLLSDEDSGKRNEDEVTPVAEKCSETLESCSKKIHRRSSTSKKINGEEMEHSSGNDTEGDDMNDEDDDDAESNEVDDAATNKETDVKGKKEEALEVPSLFQLFVNTIWERGGNPQEDEEDDENGEVPKDGEEEKLLRKFGYGVEVPIPVVKTAEQIYLDSLWAEMDIALGIMQNGSVAPSPPVVEAEKLSELNTGESSVGESSGSNEKEEIDQSVHCSRGKHVYTMDEQVGIYCRFCPFVKTEIRYILPRVEAPRYERPVKKRRAYDDNYTMWEGFQGEYAAEESQAFFDNAEGTVWDMFPRLAENLYPHQREGFEFLWKNTAGGIEIEELKDSSHSNSIGGCVISHAPGTGKTLLTIVFLQSYMEVFKDCRAVIMAPCSMLLTWEEEFKKWKAKTPFHNLNSSDFSGKEDKMALQLLNGKNTYNQKLMRLVKLLSWSKGGSILGISYTLFEKLAGTRFRKEKGNKNPKKIERKIEDEQIKKILLEIPSLLVLDEGHTPRNTRSLIWKALSMIKTEKRIILSGTPFQNNFEELYNTLSLVRPKFLDSLASSKTQTASKPHGNKKKDARGKWALLTHSIGKNGDADDTLLERIRSMMAPFVHVHKGSILKDSLPGLRDCVVLLDPPPLQMKLIEEVQKIQNPFELEHSVCLVSIHPYLLVNCGESKKKIGRPKKGKQSCAEMKLGELKLEELAAKGFNLDEIQAEAFKMDPAQGVKTRFLMELIRLSEAKNEKVLVFCQFKHPFVLIMQQLQRHFNWTEGEDVLQMGGKDNMKQRQAMINLFNDPSSKVKVLLASTRACREGINLVGASRIVLLDVVWNPSVERQAISRAYRLGQKKLVYTYHLITSGTMEGEKYRKQVSKDRLSELVFTATESHGDKKIVSSTIQEDVILDEMVGNPELKHMFKEIIYQPKESDLVDSYF